MKVLAGASIALCFFMAKQEAAYKLGEADVPEYRTATLSAAAFNSLHRAVAPNGEGERWTEIPWETDLRSARMKAAREAKPLFMWIMDGHPLGCT